MAGENETTKEQILGLYVVGLLAVLVAFRLSRQLDPTADFFFMLIITFWGAYSFFMVFAYSNIARIFESSASKSTYERFANFLKDMAQLLLLVSFGASVIFFIWYLWAALLLILLVLGIGAAVYYPVRALRKRLRKKQK